MVGFAALTTTLRVRFHRQSLQQPLQRPGMQGAKLLCIATESSCAVQRDQAVRMRPQRERNFPRIVLFQCAGGLRVGDFVERVARRVG